MNNNEEALKLVQKCLDDWPYAATRVCSIMTRLEKVKELLKEQEPVKPKEVNMYPPGQYACGFCGHISVGSKDYHAKFCPECGRGLKWDD